MREGKERGFLSVFMTGMRAAFILSCLRSHQQFVFYFYRNFCSSALNIRVYYKYAPCVPVKFIPVKAFLLYFYIYFSSLVHNREPLDLLAPLELKDPPACRVCLEKEELLAFLDPKETE